jgi:hypothetical protein
MSDDHASKWRELKRKAAEEKDPFKLAVVLSQIAALARQEQAAVRRHLEPAIKNFRRTRRGRKVEARTEIELHAGPQLPLHTGEASGNDEMARYLKLAATALGERGAALPSKAQGPRAP